MSDNNVETDGSAAFTDLQVEDVVDGTSAKATPSSAKKYVPSGQDWFKCLKSCEARGETCTCVQEPQGHEPTKPRGLARQKTAKSLGAPTAQPTAALGDSRSIRELLSLRSDLASFDVGSFDAPHVGPMLPVAKAAMARIHELMNQASLQRFCTVHLRLNDLHYESFELTDKRLEDVETRSDNTDFYMCAKVDTHLHLSALMTSPELLAYLSEIYERDGRLPFDEKQTIGDVLLGAGFEPGKTAIDDLRTQSTSDMYRDFGEFNAAFTPFRSKALADMLFKTSVLGGRYLKEIIGRMADKAMQHNVFLEPRISIYARSYGEWEELAQWFKRAEPQHRHVLFAVQCPRVYHVWRKASAIQTFADMLTNFFGPMIEATKHPEKHPAIARLLSQISCIDTVDNEAVEDDFFVGELPPPSKYTAAVNPPYAYYTVYFWHNLRGLNALRQAKGLNTFQLRPHAGEAGPVHHLASTFLFAHGISHGINLEHQPVLQYLYYLAQVPISVSPISNACLFVPYAANPFPTLFKRGLHVTLTTDDPLQFHMSSNPQLEEYTTARHAWALSMTDLSEIARNSVLTSSADSQLREELIGGNDPCDRCNVPKRRFDFRHDERVRNCRLLGLPPPAYPVDGLQRDELSSLPAGLSTSEAADRGHRPKVAAADYNTAKVEEAWRRRGEAQKARRSLTRGLSRMLGLDSQSGAGSRMCSLM